MSKSIFISRALQPTSPIKVVTDSYQATVKDVSLLNFIPLSFEWPETKWIFFYSKTAVQQFYQIVGSEINKYSIGCFGPSTAKYCSQFASVAFHADANSDQALDLIHQYVDNDDITFVCGKKSLRSVQSGSKKKFSEIVIYDSQLCKLSTSLGHFDIAILTSPLNLESFILNGGSAEEYLAIGSTTHKAFAEHKIKADIAEYPSEEGMANSLKYLLHNNH